MVATKSAPKTAPKSAPKQPRPAGRPARTSPIARALSEMTADLRTEAEEIRGKVAQLNEYDIDVRHEIGLRLNAIEADETGKYGTRPEQQLFLVMPLGRDALRPMKQLARLYSRDEVKKLKSFRNPDTQEGLTWSHVATLMRVKDKAKTFALAEKAATQGLSSRDLNREVIRLAGGPKSKGGRKSKKAGSLMAAIADITAKCKMWQNAADTVWLAEDGLSDLYIKETADWPGKKPPQDVVDALVRVTSDIEDFLMKVRHVNHQVSAMSAQATAARQVRTPVA